MNLTGVSDAKATGPMLTTVAVKPVVKAVTKIGTVMKFEISEV
jgi:hypothetical protein